MSGALHAGSSRGGGPWPPGLVAIGLAWLASMLLWLSPGVTFPDGIGCYQYLPSAVLDGDLSFYDEWEAAGLVEPGGRILHEQVTRTGLLGNHWPSGSAVCWLPAFLVGEVAARASGAAADGGFGMARMLPPILASGLAGLLALSISWSLARRVPGIGARHATIAAIAIWFGSPLLFYSIRNSLTSHAVGPLACAACAWCAIRLRERADPAAVFAFGLAAGFAFAVRPQNAPFALLPLFVLGAPQLRAASRLVPHAFVGGVIGALPQLVVSSFLYGTPWGFLRPSGGEGQAFAAFERIWIWEPLASWYHGMIPWTPVLALAACGFVFLWRADPGIGRAAMFCFATQWAINATLERSFWGGYAFGQRRFDNCTVFFVLGLAALLARLPRWVGIASVAACCAWTTLLVLAVPRVDLNAYQPPLTLVEAQAATLRDPLAWLRPLSAVPEGFRWQVLAWVAAMLAVAGALAWLLRRASLRTLAWLATAWLLGASLLFLRAGFASRAAATRHAGMIEFNRSLGMMSGAVDFRLGLLREEMNWLESTGRPEDAAVTRAEIEDIEMRRAGMTR